MILQGVVNDNVLDLNVNENARRYVREKLSEMAVSNLTLPLNTPINLVPA